MKWFERVMLVIVVLVQIKDMKSDITNLCVLKCVWLCSWLWRSTDNVLLLSVATSGREPIMFQHSREGALLCFLLLFVVSLFAFSFCFDYHHVLKGLNARSSLYANRVVTDPTAARVWQVIENSTCKVLCDIKWSHWLKCLYMACDGVFLLSVVVFFAGTGLQQIWASCGEVTMRMVVWFCKLCKVLVMKVWTLFIRVCPAWAVNKSG